MSTDFGTVVDVRKHRRTVTQLDVSTQAGLVTIHMHDTATELYLCLDEPQLEQLIRLLRTAAMHEGLACP